MLSLAIPLHGAELPARAPRPGQQAMLRAMSTIPYQRPGIASSLIADWPANRAKTSAAQGDRLVQRKDLPKQLSCLPIGQMRSLLEALRPFRGASVCATLRPSVCRKAVAPYPVAVLRPTLFRQEARRHSAFESIPRRCRTSERRSVALLNVTEGHPAEGADVLVGTDRIAPGDCVSPTHQNGLARATFRALSVGYADDVVETTSRVSTRMPASRTFATLVRTPAPGMQATHGLGGGFQSQLTHEVETCFRVVRYPSLLPFRSFAPPRTCRRKTPNQAGQRVGPRPTLP